MSISEDLKTHIAGLQALVPGVVALEKPVPPPVPVVNEVLSPWGAWPPCVNGSQTRTRTVITPASGGGVGGGKLTESQACVVTPPVVIPPGPGTGGAPTFIFALPGPGNSGVIHYPVFLGQPFESYVGNSIEDPNGDPMTIAAVKPLPAGWTVDSAAKRLKWSGVGVAALTNDLILSVSDNHGNTTNSAPFSIRVFDPPGGTPAPTATFVKYPIPKLYGTRPLTVAKHMRMAVCPTNKRVYVCGGDYDGGQNQAQSGRWELWSFDPATPNDWLLEYPYVGPAGEVQPAGPDEASFVWDPVRKMFLSGPGNYGHHAGLVRPGFATGIGQSHLCGFDPLTKKWADLGAITGSVQGAGYGQLVGRELIGGYDHDTMWMVNVDTLVGTTKASNGIGYVGYSQQSAWDGDHTMYFYDYRGRLIAGDTVTKKLTLVLDNMPSASRLFLNMVWNTAEKLIELYVGAVSGFGQVVAIDPVTKKWWALGSDYRGNMAMHYPGKGTFMVGGLSDIPVDRISKIVVSRSGVVVVDPPTPVDPPPVVISPPVVVQPPVVIPPVGTGWYDAVPKDTWHQIPGTALSTASVYNAALVATGVKGRVGGELEFGGLAADRINSRFLGAAMGGGAGARSGNHGFEYNLKTPGVNLLWAPDDVGSLWTGTPPELMAYALNRVGRPNSAHASRSLVYSPRSKSLFKFSSGQTWERDAGNFGNVFEAQVWGANLPQQFLGWEPADKHPNIPGFNQATLDWRLTDWRNGDLYVAMNEKVYKYDEVAKAYTSWLKNPTGAGIGRGSSAIMESANVILLIGQGTTAVPRRNWEFDIATGAMLPVTITGPAEAAILYSPSRGMASDPVGDCIWYFKDDQKLYRLKRTGQGAWEATEHPLLGTPPGLYESGVRNSNPGTGTGIYNGFDYFPELKGLAWVSRADRDVRYVRLYD